MKSSIFRSLSVFSLCLAFSAACARADDAAATVAPPPFPPSPQTSPAEGGAHPRHRRPGYVLAELTQRLGLTADQQKTVGAIIASSRAQTKELRGDESMAKEERRQKMRGILASARSQIRAALTPDQQKAFDALPANGGNPPPPAN